MQSILIANRGEIAVRIIRACRELDIRAIALYSDADDNALHVRLADQACWLGPAPASESYLHIERIVEVARASGAEAVHPGYGLLSESAEFAAAVTDAGLTFIGPSADVIATMGDKLAAREAAERSDVPLLPGSDGAITDPEQAAVLAESIGLPVVIKACFGGGGRGMRVADKTSDVKSAMDAAARESNAAFGRAEVYLEHYVSQARHVEVQILGDGEGHVIHIGDRDCSVQRRHQKLIEEAPAPGLSAELRGELAAAAVRLAQSVNYRSAGTVEFLVDPEREAFYFLEMNTRLQVEHGVTELVSGVDLVQAQIRIASGQPLAFDQADIGLSGHAMQARIGAEDPWENFQPSPGRVDDLRLPLGPWLRLDFGVEACDHIPSYYDSMFGKLQAWGRDRDSARRRLAGALRVLRVSGVATTAPYLVQVLGQTEFIQARHDTGSVERDWPPDPDSRPQPPAVSAQQEQPMAEQPLAEDRVVLSTTTGDIEIAVFGRGDAVRASRTQDNEGSSATANKSSEPVAPMDGSVVSVAVEAGQDVDKGAVLVTLEAMKMEVPVRAPRAGVVEQVLVECGQAASRGDVLVKLSSAEAA